MSLQMFAVVLACCVLGWTLHLQTIDECNQIWRCWCHTSVDCYIIYFQCLLRSSSPQFLLPSRIWSKFEFDISNIWSNSLDLYIIIGHLHLTILAIVFSRRHISLSDWYTRRCLRWRHIRIIPQAYSIFDSHSHLMWGSSSYIQHKTFLCFAAGYFHFIELSPRVSSYWLYQICWALVVLRTCYTSSQYWSAHVSLRPLSYVCSDHCSLSSSSIWANIKSIDCQLWY